MCLLFQKNGKSVNTVLKILLCRFQRMKSGLHSRRKDSADCGILNFIKFKEIRHKLFILTYYINLINPPGLTEAVNKA